MLDVMLHYISPQPNLIAVVDGLLVSVSTFSAQSAIHHLLTGPSYYAVFDAIPGKDDLLQVHVYNILCCCTFKLTPLSCL